MRVAALLALALVACQGAATPSAETVSFRLRGTPNDATVTIDDIQLGSVEYVATRGVALPKGIHHLIVEAPGYFPFDKELDAKVASQPIVVVVKLEPIPD